MKVITFGQILFSMARHTSLITPQTTGCDKDIIVSSPVPCWYPPSAKKPSVAASLVLFETPVDLRRDFKSSLISLSTNRNASLDNLKFFLYLKKEIVKILF